MFLLYYHQYVCICAPGACLFVCLLVSHLVIFFLLLSSILCASFASYSNLVMWSYLNLSISNIFISLYKWFYVSRTQVAIKTSTVRWFQWKNILLTCLLPYQGSIKRKFLMEQLEAFETHFFIAPSLIRLHFSHPSNNFFVFCQFLLIIRDE